MRWRGGDEGRGGGRRGGGAESVAKRKEGKTKREDVEVSNEFSRTSRRRKVEKEEQENSEEN